MLLGNTCISCSEFNMRKLHLNENLRPYEEIDSNYLGFSPRSLGSEGNFSPVRTD